MPLHDWQFWVVSAAALVALIVVVRTVVPPKLLPKPFRKKDKGRRATLTISGKPVTKD